MLVSFIWGRTWGSIDRRIAEFHGRRCGLPIAQLQNPRLLRRDAGGHEMGEAGGQGGGLARAGPGDDEEVAAVVGGGTSLLLCELRKVEHLFEHSAQPLPNLRVEQASPCKLYNFRWSVAPRSGGEEASWTATCRG